MVRDRCTTILATHQRSSPNNLAMENRKSPLWPIPDLLHRVNQAVIFVSGNGFGVVAQKKQNGQLVGRVHLPALGFGGGQRQGDVFEQSGFAAAGRADYRQVLFAQRLGPHIFPDHVTALLQVCRQRV